MGQENIASIINDDEADWKDARLGPHGNVEVAEVDGVFSISRWEVPGVERPTIDEVLARELMWQINKEKEANKPETKILAVKLDAKQMQGLLVATIAKAFYPSIWSQVPEEVRDDIDAKLLAVIQKSFGAAFGRNPS